MASRFSKFTFAALLLAIVQPAPLWACLNDMTPQQSAKVDDFATCQEALRTKKATKAKRCLVPMADDLDIFVGHPLQTQFVAEFWHVLGLTHLANGDFEKARSNFETSNKIEARSKLQMDLSFWQQTTDRSPDQLLREASAIAIHRINVMRNPKIQDRQLTASRRGKNSRLKMPDVDARNVIFFEAGLIPALNRAGFDELDKDLMFMKAARNDVKNFVNAYVDQFEKSSLVQLREKAKHYYGIH